MVDVEWDNSNGFFRTGPMCDLKENSTVSAYQDVWTETDSNVLTAHHKSDARNNTEIEEWKIHWQCKDEHCKKFGAFNF